VIYYDNRNKRLVYTGDASSAEFWDGFWMRTETSASVFRPRTGKRAWVVKVTNAYLKPGDGPILEGGCGGGDKLSLLHHHGFQVVGVDYARRTVETLSRVAPELDVRYGDVRRLDFADGYFAGYWSLGVIEHFHEGYEAIALEMARVIRPGGYLFITFPWMNRIRRIKARRGVYPIAKDPLDEPFYQFALHAPHVRRDFEHLGFQMVAQGYPSVISGMIQDARLLARPLAALQRVRNRDLPTKAMWYALDRVLNTTVGGVFSHEVLLVMRKIASVSQRRASGTIDEETMTVACEGPSPALS